MSENELLENKVAVILAQLEEAKSYVESHSFSLAFIVLGDIRYNLGQANMLADQKANEE